MGYWKGKRVLVTGACRGLGLVLTRQLLAQEARVVIHSNLTPLPNDELLLKAIENGQAIHIRADLCSVDETLQLMAAVDEHFDGLDVLIHNAGISAHGSFMETTSATFRQVIDTNLSGLVALTKAALPSVIKAQGSLFFISSLAAIYGVPNYLSYSISKAALVPLQEGLELELKPYGVHVGLVYLGFVENDQVKYALNTVGDKIPVPQRKIRTKISKDRAATKILWAIEKRKRKIFGDFSGSLMWLLKMLLPATLRMALNRNQKR
ncbi:MAG: SDR family NAD(P)-dependent oxidoreductase [Bacteroidetes bacterium]|nr:SDR family NAD(P)-dependent oxidoreductase [Bacteroidota bacterium]